METDDESGGTLNYWKTEAIRVRSDLDEYMESSKELENALEQEILESEKRNIQLKKERDSLVETLSKKAEVEKTQAEGIMKLQQKITSLSVELNQTKTRQRELEQSNERLISETRAHKQTLLDVKLKLDTQIEQYVFLQTEKEELQEQYLEETERLRSSLNETKEELEIQLKRITKAETAFASTTTMTEAASGDNDEIVELKKTIDNQAERIEVLKIEKENMKREYLGIIDTWKSENQTLTDEISTKTKSINLLQSNLNSKTDELAQLKKEKNKLYEEYQEEIESLRAGLSEVEDSLREKDTFVPYSQECESKKVKANNGLDAHKTSFYATNSNDIEDLRSAYQAQLESNAALLSEVQKLRGNILVFCRIRPFVDDAERRDGRVGVEAVSPEELAFYDTRQSAWKPFGFDRVFPPGAKQYDVWREISNLGVAESVVGGYKACIMAYGQTNSGKTYTMEGEANNPGITQNLIKRIFEVTRGMGKTEGIRLAMLEIYNDDIRDLLQNFRLNNLSQSSVISSGSSATLSSNNTYDSSYLHNRKSISATTLEGATWINCSSIAEVENTLQAGCVYRSTAETAMNHQSSRSHLIQIIQCVDGNGSVYLVDLAGSENVQKSEVTGTRLDEAKHINKSLSALGDVMEALDRRANNNGRKLSNTNQTQHIPYRNSKLTMVLQPALSANSRTILMLNVPSSASMGKETGFSLQFGARVRNIELGPARKHVERKNAQSVVDDLKVQLHKASNRAVAAESKLAELSRKFKSSEVQLKTEKASIEKSADIQKRKLTQQYEALTKEVQGLRVELVQTRQQAKQLQSKCNKDEKNGKMAKLHRDRSIQELQIVIKEQKEEIQYLRRTKTRRSATIIGSPKARDEREREREMKEVKEEKQSDSGEKQCDANSSCESGPIKSLIPRPQCSKSSKRRMSRAASSSFGSATRKTILRVPFGTRYE